MTTPRPLHHVLKTFATKVISVSVFETHPKNLLEESLPEALEDQKTLQKMKNISATCYEDILHPNFSLQLFDFEKNFDYWGKYWWFYSNWKLCYYFIAVYLVAILAGHQYMKRRPPFQLRKALLLWNVSLALFSIAASCRAIPVLVDTLRQDGLHPSLCSPWTAQHKQGVAIWLYWFALSKVVELGDTAFIVLRKTPLIFLHWYHHVTVLFAVWSSSGWPSTIYRHFAVVNYSVHSVMYSHYALRAARVKIPKTVSMAVTALQLVQMVICLTVIGYASYLKSKDDQCCLYDETVWISLGIYASYFILFGHFFIKTYFPNKGSPGTGAFKKSL